MKLSYIALAAVAAALLSSPAQAQADIVTQQLDGVVEKMAERGFVPLADAMMGTLAEGGDQEYDLELEGNDYVVFAFCDNGCRDLDLALTDEGGDEVESDRADDDYPVLTLGTQRGTFVLSVEMADCSRSECHYGVRVFRKR